jgi:hypothetical protein
LREEDIRPARGPIGLTPSVFVPQFLIRLVLAAAARHSRHARSLTIPFGGLSLDRRTVRNHRYLREHGLPHCADVAETFLGFGK